MLHNKFNGFLDKSRDTVLKKTQIKTSMNDVKEYYDSEILRLGFFSI